MGLRNHTTRYRLRPVLEFDTQNFCSLKTWLLQFHMILSCSLIAFNTPILFLLVLIRHVQSVYNGRKLTVSHLSPAHGTKPKIN